MEGSLEGGGLSGPGGPQTNGETTQTWEEMQSRVHETLEVLSPQELRNFRAILQKVDEEPRVTALKLELEGGSTRGLARLLAKHYHPLAAPRVLVKVLRQLPRTDLLPRWQSDPAAGQGIPRKALKRSYDCVDGDLDCYDLRGRRNAFLMCVKKNRPGSEWDVGLMKKWLSQCQFECTPCIDPDKKELLEKLTSFRDGLNEIKDEISCCLVTLMSHGENGYLKIRDDERVSLEEIFEMFNNKNCPALKEKPKIFIIQACRGERRDSGVETDDEPMDLDDISEKKRLPTFSDYFIIYPTQAAQSHFRGFNYGHKNSQRQWRRKMDEMPVFQFVDHVALRHPRTGSVMIEAMTEIFQQHGNKFHIVDFFTKVNNKVVHTEFFLREEPIKVSLVMESTLTRFVYF